MWTEHNERATPGRLSPPTVVEGAFGGNADSPRSRRPGVVRREGVMGPSRGYICMRGI